MKKQIIFLFIAVLSIAGLQNNAEAQEQKGLNDSDKLRLHKVNSILLGMEKGILMNYLIYLPNGITLYKYKMPWDIQEKLRNKAAVDPHEAELREVKIQEINAYPLEIDEGIKENYLVNFPSGKTSSVSQDLMRQRNELLEEGAVDPHQNDPNGSTTGIIEIVKQEYLDEIKKIDSIMILMADGKIRIDHHLIAAGYYISDLDALRGKRDYLEEQLNLPLSEQDNPFLYTLTGKTDSVVYFKYGDKLIEEIKMISSIPQIKWYFYENPTLDELELVLFNEGEQVVRRDTTDVLVWNGIVPISETRAIEISAQKIESNILTFFSSKPIEEKSRLVWLIILLGTGIIAWILLIIRQITLIAKRKSINWLTTVDPSLLIAIFMGGVSCWFIISIMKWHYYGTGLARFAVAGFGALVSMILGIVVSIRTGAWPYIFHQGTIKNKKNEEN